MGDYFVILFLHLDVMWVNAFFLKLLVRLQDCSQKELLDGEALLESQEANFVTDFHNCVFRANFVEKHHFVLLFYLKSSCP